MGGVEGGGKERQRKRDLSKANNVMYPGIM